MLFMQVSRKSISWFKGYLEGTDMIGLTQG